MLSLSPPPGVSHTVPQFPSNTRQGVEGTGQPLSPTAAAMGGAQGSPHPSPAPQLLLIPPQEGMPPAPAPKQQLPQAPVPAWAPPAVPTAPPTAPQLLPGGGWSSCPPWHAGDVRDGGPGDAASCSPRGEGRCWEGIRLPPPTPSLGTGSSQAPAAALAAWLRCGGGSCAGSSRSCPQMSPCPQGAAELNAARAAAPASPHAGSERAASLPAGKGGCGGGGGTALPTACLERAARHAHGGEHATPPC